MKLFTFLMGLALLATQFVIIAATAVQSIEKSASIGLDDVPEGYAVAPATFTGSIEGEAYEINGTAGSVLAELQAKHPNVDWDARASAAFAALENNDTTSDSAAGLINKRGGKVLPPLCLPIRGWNWKVAEEDGFYDCAHRMFSVGGRFTMQPRTCSRICCSDYSLVVLCNDRQDVIRPDVKYIGSYITDICKKCSVGWNGHQFVREAGGQLFDSDGYNVIARRNSKRCV